jgi:hypothetical protein
MDLLKKICFNIAFKKIHNLVKFLMKIFILLVSVYRRILSILIKIISWKVNEMYNEIYIDVNLQLANDDIALREAH